MQKELSLYVASIQSLTEQLGVMCADQVSCVGAGILVAASIPDFRMKQKIPGIPDGVQMKPKDMFQHSMLTVSLINLLGRSLNWRFDRPSVMENESQRPSFGWFCASLAWKTEDSQSIVFHKLLKRLDDRGTLCYARRTLVGRSETKSSQGRYSRRDTASLKQLEILRSKVEWCEGLKPNAQGLKNTLNCVEQEWRLQYRQLATYAMGHVSVELHRTSENQMSNEEYITDTRESVRRRRLSIDKD